MKKIPTLYTKNSKGRYQEYKIPDLDISKTFYRKINGKYEPTNMLLYDSIEEGVWVVTRQSSTTNIIRADYLRESFHLDKAADIERFPLSKMGHIKKVAERIIGELRLGNTDTRVMTNNELVKLVVGLVYKYNEEV
jgi:hypothetical protein